MNQLPADYLAKPFLSIDPPLDGPTNMGRDAELLGLLAESALAARIYSWDEPWVSLGMFQRPEADLKPSCPIPFVMRPTGGRAVLHGHDVTVGLAVRLAALAANGQSSQDLSRSVRSVYRQATSPLIAALRKCGVDACLGEVIKAARPGPKSADCFAHIGANDIIDRARLTKVCGVAMKLTESAVLIQASIPVSHPICDPSLVFDKPWLGRAATIDRNLVIESLAQEIKSFALELST